MSQPLRTGAASAERMTSGSCTGAGKENRHSHQSRCPGRSVEKWADFSAASNSPACNLGLEAAVPAAPQDSPAVRSAVVAADLVWPPDVRPAAVALVQSPLLLLLPPDMCHMSLTLQYFEYRCPTKSEPGGMLTRSARCQAHRSTSQRSFEAVQCKLIS